MKKIITITVLLACTGLFAADKPENGFYLRDKDNPTQSIRSQDGRRVFLGEKQSLKIQASSISSSNNANTRFSLTVTVPYDEKIGPSSYVLIVDGKAYRQMGSGSSQKKTSSLSFCISGKKNAGQVSKFLKTPVVYRRHPRHNFLVSFTTAKDEFHVGEEVTVTLRIENVGVHDVAFMKGGRNRAARDNQYIFSARYRGKQVDDIGTSNHFGGIAVRKVLKPGDVFEDRISLSKWFAFDKPGFYQIHGSYYLDFNDSDKKSYMTIWEDYVSADFHVNIKEAKKKTEKPALKRESDPAVKGDHTARLRTVITCYMKGDVDGIREMASRKDARLMWVPKDPKDANAIKRMKEFGKFLSTTKPRWSLTGETKAVASFGPEVKAWHIRLVKKNGKWFLYDVNGGD